jgi:hypothetical protein
MPMMTPAQRDAMMQTMKKVHAQMAALHHQAHAQVLAALSSAHRAMLVNLLGQAAIADKPDHKGLVTKLDAALSPSEKAAILKIAANLETKSRAMMLAAHKAMLANLPKDVQARAAAMHSRMKASTTKHHKRTPDAGKALLALATNHGGHGMMMRMHRGMMGPGMMGPGMRGPGMGGTGMGGPGMGRMRGPGGPRPPAPAPSST